MKLSKNKEKIKHTLEVFLNDILGLKTKKEKNLLDNKISSELIELLIKLRNQSRVNKDFKLSDQIRDDLLKIGIQLNDDKNKSSYKMI